VAVEIIVAILSIITIATAMPPLRTRMRSRETPGQRGGERVVLSGGQSLREADWWRRGELNPCPRSCLRKLLHAYPMVSFKRPNVAPAHCRPPSVHEIPSPPGAVTPPND